MTNKRRLSTRFLSISFLTISFLSTGLFSASLLRSSCLIFVSSLALGLFGSASALAHDGLKYDEPYARATPPNAANSAIFMTIENHMDHERTLISAQTDIAHKAELHTVEKDGDLMKMRQVESIVLPAHGEVVLKPGGYHIMLLNVKQPLAAGDNVTLTLVYADGETETLSVPVKNVMAGMQQHAAKDQDNAHSMH